MLLTNKQKSNLNLLHFEIYEKYKQGNVIIKKICTQVFKMHPVNKIVYDKTLANFSYSEDIIVPL